MGRFNILSGKHGFQLGLAAFAVLALGGSAFYMSKNIAVQYKTGASNKIESAQGKLVKKDTPAFSPCKDLTTPYALIGGQPTTPEQAKTATPGSNKDMTKTPSACTPLTIPSDFAEPLVGKKVIVSGTYRDGVFYGTTISEVFSADGSPKASPKVNPTPRGSKP